MRQFILVKAKMKCFGDIFTQIKDVKIEYLTATQQYTDCTLLIKNIYIELNCKAYHKFAKEMI